MTVRGSGDNWRIVIVHSADPAMPLIFFTDPREFLDRAGEFLCRCEAENNVILGSAAIGIEISL